MNLIRNLLALSVVVLLAACDGPTYTYRYRLTLEVVADGHVYSASSVVEVSEFRKARVDLSPGIVNTKLVGEATLVDLGAGRVLIALLESIPDVAKRQERSGLGWIGPAPTAMLAQFYGITYEWHGFRNEGLAQLVRQRGVKELRFDQLPTLLTFRDAADPTSAVVVDPANLAKSFGDGVRLKSAKIEVTDAPLTLGLADKLPWLKTGIDQLDGARSCDYRRTTTDLPFCPHGGHFIQRRK